MLEHIAFFMTFVPLKGEYRFHFLRLKNERKWKFYLPSSYPVAYSEGVASAKSEQRLRKSEQEVSNFYPQNKLN